jgi:hypothetical protein
MIVLMTVNRNRDDYIEGNWNINENDNLSVKSEIVSSDSDPDLGVITGNLAAEPGPDYSI